MTEKTQLETLCEQKNITLTLKPGPPPIDDDEDGNWKRDAHRYLATIHVGEESYTTPFYTGSGWTEHPTVVDVMASLLLDASAFQDSTDIDDFADNLGITKVSQAVKIYRACEETYYKLMDLLGGNLEDLDEFMEAANEY